MPPVVKRLILLGVVAVTGLVVVASVMGRPGGLPPANPVAASASASTPATAAEQSRLAAEPQRPPERVLQLQKQLAENPDDADALAALVDQLLQGRRYAEAADLLAQAVDRSPNNARLRVGLGTALFYVGLPTMAQRELKRATELDPGNADAHFNYALSMSHGPGANIGVARVSWEAVVRLDGNGEMGRRAREFLAQTSTGSKQ